MPRIASLAAIALLLSGCIGRTTESVVGYADPGGMVVVAAGDFDPAAYDYDDLRYVKLPNGNYLVPRSALRRLGGYLMILVAAPVTITIDTVTYPVEGIGGHDLSLPHDAHPSPAGGQASGRRDGGAELVVGLIRMLCGLRK